MADAPDLDPAALQALGGDAAGDAPAAAKPAKGGMGGKIKVAAIVLVVMAVEAGVFFMVAGGGETTPDPAAIEEEELLATEDSVEVPLEKFICTNSRAAPGSIIHITLELTALVADGQASTFTESVTTSHRARIRQAVLKVIRSASLDDLADPNYTSLKRLIREEINKVMRKSVVNDIVVSDFSKMEQ